MNINDPAFGYWFAGLTDAGGCFSFNGNTPRFKIAFREDDLAVLEYARETLGVGRIYHCDRSADRKNGSRKRDQVSLEVFGKPTVEVLIPLFDRYPLRSKKKLQYEEWRKKAISARFVRTKPLAPEAWREKYLIASC